MKFSVDWIEDAINAAAAERATVGDFRVFVAGANATVHLHAEAVRDHVRVALFSLADGLTQDWWNIFGQRDREFSLAQYRSGFIIPDVRFRFDGAAFEVAAHAKTFTAPDLRFWQSPAEILDRATAEATLADFVQTVIDRLASRGVVETSLALRWDRVSQSRGNSGEAAFCEAAGALGLDPYAIDDAVADRVEQAERLFDGEPLTEFVAGARHASQDRLLDWVSFVERRSPFKARLPELDDAARECAIAAPDPGDIRAWALGYARARAMRHVLDLDAAARIRSFRDLSKLFEASTGFELAQKVDGIRALRTTHDNGTRIHLRNHGDTDEARSQHLFSLARAIGDVACFPATERAPINDLHHASRQATGRAFAAEFLAPIDEIESMRHDDRDLVSIADEFGVATTVIERQLENRDRIHASRLFLVNVAD